MFTGSISLHGFLIDKDRDIDEGLQLTDKALELSQGHENGICSIAKVGVYLKRANLKRRLKSLKNAGNQEDQKLISIQIYLHLEAAKKAVTGLKNI